MSGNNSFGGINLPWLRDTVENARGTVENAMHSVAENIDNIFHPDQQQGSRQPGRDQNRRQQQWHHQQQPPPPPPQPPAAGFSFPFQQQFQQQWQQPQAPPPNQNAVPPASAKALRQLPTIRVAPEDLVEPSNRECCICLEPNRLGEIVSRLPCAHIFHSHCVIDWLNNHHCTCPVCRYELPTDDPAFEAGRMERMKYRKPRFAMHELKRMSIPQLKALYDKNRNDHPANKIRVIDKSDLIHLLIDSERVHLIPSPDPVSYKLSVLKAMGIGELKRTMEDAGVFFDRSMVVEKSDMVTLFQNSGRLEIIPEVIYQNVDNNGYRTHRQQQEQHQDTFAGQPKVAHTGSMQQTDASIPNANQDSSQNPARVDDKNATIVETVESDGEDDDNELPRTSEGGETAATTTPMEMFGSNGDDELSSRSRVFEEIHPSSASQATTAAVDPINENLTDSLQNEAMTEVTAALGQLSDVIEDGAGSHSNRLEVPVEQNVVDTPVEASTRNGPSVASLERRDETTPSIRDDDKMGTEDEIQQTNPFKDCSISELRAIARRHQVDLSQCVERSEMVHLLSKAGATVIGQEQPLCGQLFANWSASNILMLADEVDVDLSQCSDREDMLRQLEHVSNHERPHVKQYLISLAPLASSSVSELRATARDWKININDCVEKEEIFRRLVKRGRQFGVC